MSNKIDPNLIRELEEYGLKDVIRCYSCRNCTATSELSTPESPFPRKMVRYIQPGLSDRIFNPPAGCAITAVTVRPGAPVERTPAKL